MDPWHLAHESACRLAEGRSAVRLTNLALAATTGSDSSLDGRQLRAAVKRLAVSGRLELGSDPQDWRNLARASRIAAHELVGPAGHDCWVTASQGADPARKSRGAYATPRALADPMARLLLDRSAGTPERILDPSAGGGGLLLAVLRCLAGPDPGRERLAEAARRLHGVELDPVARELCCLQIWLACRGSQEIESIAARIHCDNSVTRNWQADGLYEALIMNPPWESLRHAGASDEAERGKTVERLGQSRPLDSDLPPLFSCQGRGDRNLYKAFLELAPHVVVQGSPIVALVPGAWSSDMGTRPLRELYLSRTDIEQWTSFENREGYFPIDGRYKFGVLLARRDSMGTRSFRIRGMAGEVSCLTGPHVRISKAMLTRIGGPSRLIPDLVSRREARLLGKFAAAGSEFFAPSAAFGPVAYERELDLTEDRKRGKFQHADSAAGRIAAARWVGDGGQQLRPLVEGRMVGQYDFFEKSWLDGAGRTARWSYNNGHRLKECRPQFLAPPLASPCPRLAICDITSATNTRTVRASWLPPRWRCGNTAPVLAFEDESRALAALAVLNSMVFDWQARRIVAGLHLNRFYLEAMRWPNVGAAAIQILARRAREILSLNRRFREAAPLLAISPTEIDHVEAHVEIESIVADGFGLASDDLEAIFDPSDRDRRGFWRSYRNDPCAASVAEHFRQPEGRRRIHQGEALALKV